MITRIEQAITDRLKRGLGQMVRTVKSYNGEADDLAGQIHTLPAVWVTFGGCKVEKADSGNFRYRNSGEFVVMCATRSLRNEQALRQGGIDIREVGSNDLITAVRRLLDGQRVAGDDSRGLIPKAIRPIANHVLVTNAAVSIYAVEYTLHWNSMALENGRFPEEARDPADPDYLFTKYKGELSAPYPPFEIMDGLIIDPRSGAKLPHHFDLRKSDGQD